MLNKTEPMWEPCGTPLEAKIKKIDWFVYYNGFTILEI